MLVRDRWIGFEKIIRGFANDLDIADHGILFQRVGEEFFAAHSFGVVKNAVRGLKNVIDKIFGSEVLLAHRCAASDRTFSRNLG